MSAGPAAAHRPGVRRSPSPRAPRRVSGPARTRPRAVASAGAVAAPRPVALPQPLAPRALEALLRLPDSRWLDRLLRGRAWIALLAAALIGLVFMQVSMLGMNAGIGQSVERSQVLERQNADLRATVSSLSSEERIQRTAADMGMVMPQAGDVRFLQSRGARADAARAAQIMRAPNPLTPTSATLAATTGAAAATEQAPAPTTASQQATAEATQPDAATPAPVAPQAAAPAPAPTAPAPQAAPAPAPAPAAPTQAAAPQAAAPATGAAVAPGTGQ